MTVQSRIAASAQFGWTLARDCVHFKTWRENQTVDAAA